MQNYYEGQGCKLNKRDKIYANKQSIVIVILILLHKFRMSHLFK